ncbi:MAG: hypothetical protein GY742_14825 [Hyphomicrobiales bacterium]|nr:hypothetical protein [Hyphomicrobiales bacterium]
MRKIGELLLVTVFTSFLSTLIPVPPLQSFASNIDEPNDDKKVFAYNSSDGDCPNASNANDHK